MTDIFACLVIVLAGCSGSPLDPGAGSNPGTGTNTLMVHGSASAEPEMPDAKTATDFTTHFDLQVSLNGMPVTTGTVKVISSSGTTSLTFSNNNNQSGHWRGQAANYDEVYELSVTSGPDKVSGVYVDGPNIHQFTTPKAGATLDSTMPNTLDWTRTAAAMQARFRVNDADAVTIPDSGTYTIPPGMLMAQRDQSRPNTLTVTRTNSITPKGAVSGSQFSVSVSNALDVVVLANPALP